MASHSKRKFDAAEALLVLDDISSCDASEISENDEEDSNCEILSESESCESMDLSESEVAVGSVVTPRPSSLCLEKEVDEKSESLESESPDEISLERETNVFKPGKETRKIGKGKAVSRFAVSNVTRGRPKKHIHAQSQNLASKASKKSRKEESQHSKWANDKNWNKTCSERAIPLFVGKQGPQMRRTSLPEKLSSKVFFEQYFTDEVWQLLVDMTNANAIGKNVSSWKNINVAEMKAFFGLLLAMGLLKLPKIKDYWRKINWLIHVSSFGEVMPRDRFLQLYRYLHVCNDNQQIPRGQDGHDPLFKIRSFLNLISDRFRNVYKPSRDICIDESLIPYKGRIYFRQFIPSKRARFGIKAFVLCESDTGYVSEIVIYTGKDANQTISKGLAEKVVLKLTEGYQDVNHHLYLDNYYTKAWLLKSLEEKGIYASGTARVDRSGFPKEIVIASKRGKDRGYSDWRMNGSILATSWLDNKGVHFLSTIHEPEYKDDIQDKEKVVKRRGKKGHTGAVEIPCPPIVQPYNKKMGGVDFCDHMIKFYNIGRRSRKWYRRVLFHILELCIHNAFILGSCFIPHEVGKKTPKRQNFREELIELLIGQYRARKRTVGRPSVAHENELRFQNVGVHLPVYNTDRKDCQLCKETVKSSRGGKIGKIDRRAAGVHVTYISCEMCNVHLCLNKDRNCFKLWHTRV